MIIHANAKINLSLDVLGRRPNGYHDVKMIMQSVDLYDEIELKPNDEKRIIIKCDNNEIECNESNLIFRAAGALMDYVGSSDGVTITLTKNIPIAAGMAGGSTDAAATLIGLNRLFNYGLDKETLKKIGVTLGADIPFCIDGGTCLSEGIGEILTALPSPPNCFLVIVKPDISVSTRYVYEHLVLNGETRHPDVDGMIRDINDGNLSKIAGGLGNLLETVTVEAYPVIARLKQILLKEGALNSLMSGSGPTVFGLFDDRDKAERALEACHREEDFKQGFVTVMSNQGIIIVNE